jgi:hypothetical protein
LDSLPKPCENLNSYEHFAKKKKAVGTYAKKHGAKILNTTK